MKNLQIIIVLLFLPNAILQSQVTDIDGNTYATVKIGQQEWMAEELRTTRYADETPITEYKHYDESKWETHDAYWDWVRKNIFDQANFRVEDQTYSYSGNVIKSGKSLCPKGWRIPTHKDWDILIETLGGLEVAGLKLRSKTGWPEGSNGKNESGFNALPTKVNTFREFCPQPNAVWWCASGCKTKYLCSESGFENEYDDEDEVEVEKNDIKIIFTSIEGDGSMYDYACVRCVKE